MNKIHITGFLIYSHTQLSLITIYVLPGCMLLFLQALPHVVLQYIAVLFLMLEHIYAMAITLSDRYRRLRIILLYQLAAHNVRIPAAKLKKQSSLHICRRHTLLVFEAVAGMHHTCKRLLVCPAHGTGKLLHHVRIYLCRRIHLRRSLRVLLHASHHPAEHPFNALHSRECSPFKH